MSLFERIKNKRYDLQEKRKFPGDESGAYKRAKDDLEARKGFSKNKPGGLKADEKNPFVKRSVRKTRVDKLGGDIYDAPKFSQKGFEKSLKDTQKVADKAFKSDVKTFKKIGLKPPKRGDFTSKSRPGGKLVIPDPFGKGDTPGQIRVKGLETKAFKKTQPSDIKLPKSFTDFSSKLQDYKDKDKATMRTGKSSSKVKVTGANNLTRQDVGMAPPDTRSKAQKFTDKINTAKASKNTMSSGKNFINKYKKQAETATTNLRKQVDTIAKNPTLTGGEKAKQSREVMKKVKTAQNFARGYKNNPSSAVVRTSDLNTVTSAAKGSIVKPKPYTGVTAKGNPSRAIKPFAKITSQATIKDISKQTGNLKQLKNYKYYAGAKKLAAKSPIAKKAIVGAGKILGRLGTRGRIAAGALSFIPTLAANPGVRSFVKNTALFGGLAAITGLAKPKQNVLKVGKGVTKTTNLPSKFQPKNAKNLSYVDSYGKKRKLESGDVRFKFGLTGTKPGGKPGGMQYNKQDMARVKNIQKKYIDSYNASVKGNPFKKQIKYSVNKDGSYTVTPPKKK